MGAESLTTKTTWGDACGTARKQPKRNPGTKTAMFLGACSYLQKKGRWGGGWGKAERASLEGALVWGQETECARRKHVGQNVLVKLPDKHG
jgi:hypothetical protein